MGIMFNLVEVEYVLANVAEASAIRELSLKMSQECDKADSLLVPSTNIPSS